MPCSALAVRTRGFVGRRILASSFYAAAVIFFCVSHASADLLDQIKKDGRLLVGVTDSSPPFSSRILGGATSVGYDVDLAERIAQRLGVPTQQVTLRNQDRISFLQQGRVHLVAVGMSRTAERAKSIDFSFAYLDSPHKIIVRKDANFTSMLQLADRKLALNKGASVDDELKAAVPTIRLVNYDNYELCFEAVKERRADAFLADQVLLLAMAQKESNPNDYMLIPDYDGPRTSGFGLPKNEPRFKAFVNATLLDLEASGEAESIFGKWFGGTRRSFRIGPDKPGTF
jgi:polar amino acid transport system substrate-binding protein